MNKHITQIRQRILSAAPAVLAVGLLYLIFHLTGIGCPVRFLTGVSCPGCGMTRAVFSCLSLHFREAFHYHPLVFLLPVAMTVFLLKRRFSARTFRFLTIAAVVLFISVYLIRMFITSDSVVFFCPDQGFIFRTVKKILFR